MHQRNSNKELLREHRNKHHNNRYLSLEEVVEHKWAAPEVGTVGSTALEADLHTDLADMTD